MYAARNLKLAAVALALSLALSGIALAESGAGRYDAQIQSKLAAQLQQKQQFKDVRAAVNDGVVTLSGTVDTYQHKLDAAKKARKQDHVASVRDLVEVAGPPISDLDLRAKLANKLAYSRVSYNNVFDLFTVGVQNGVATIGGEVRMPIDREYAISEVARTPGVKGVVDNVKVLPLSSYDDALRLRLARAIYGDPVLNRYALNPQAPIRIVVDGGHVALYGVVGSKTDRQIAGIRAGEVFGAFSVANHLTTDQPVAR